MHKERWLKLASGAVAIGLVVIAVVWVVAPDGAISGTAGHSAKAVSASLGPDPQRAVDDQAPPDLAVPQATRS